MGNESFITCWFLDINSHIGKELNAVINIPLVKFVSNDVFQELNSYNYRSNNDLLFEINLHEETFITEWVIMQSGRGESVGCYFSFNHHSH